MMKKYIIILSILAISCSSVQTRGSRNSRSSKSEKSSSKPSMIAEKIEINTNDILADSLGFERAYIKTLSKRQKKFLLEEYGYDEDKLREIAEPKEIANQEAIVDDIYMRDRYTDVEVTERKYELYGAEVKGGMNKFFDIAMENYDSGNMDKAKNIFGFMKESLLEDDPLWYEAAYYLGECFVNENNFKASLNTFLEILTKREIPDFVHERTLVRTGQIYCVVSENKKAFNYFLELRKRFPDSQYLEVADCSKIN